MKRYLSLPIMLSALLHFSVHAQAPVVDDSENYALLEEQASAELPTRPTRSLPKEEGFTAEEEVALAQEDNPVSENNNLDLLNKIKGLQQDIQVLRGQLDEQTNALKKLQEQQLAFYKDIDARLQKNSSSNLSSKPSGPLNLDSPETQSTGSAIPSHALKKNNPAEEQVSYLAAYELIKNKQFNEALVAMQTFVNTYPQGGYTANAYYWLGELYLIKKQYPQAIQNFDIVLKQFPSSTKKADCSLKIAYALAASGQTAAAKKRLQEVIQNYPGTPTAHLAQTKLNALNV